MEGKKTMKSIRAIFKDTVLADSDQTVQVEGNYYFPKDSIKFEYFKSSETTTACPWKGVASYHTIVVGSDEVIDAVWSYPNPSKEALQLKDHYAFWKEIKIVKETNEEKNSNITKEINEFTSQLSNSKQDVEKVAALSNLLSNLGEDNLIGVLPVKFINTLSFFNFYNSNDACFQTNSNHHLQRVNRTFSWAFGHLPNFIGKSFEDLLKHVDIIEGPCLEDFFKTIKSQGWARLPKLYLERKNEEGTYYSLDVAIAKHGDIENLSGFQCQLKNITREVQLSNTVERSKANLKSLLEGINEGLFYFEKNGSVAGERSKALKSILPNSESLTTIQDIVCRYSTRKRKDVDTCLSLLWPDDDSFMSIFEVSVTMLPSNSIIEQGGEIRNVTFNYSPLTDSKGNLEKVIVIVKDVTELLRNEKEAYIQAERVNKISYASTSSEAYLSFVEEGDSIVCDIDQEINKNVKNIEKQNIKRNLHTLKGMVSLFEFERLARNIHELESFFIDCSSESEVNKCRKKWTLCFEQWNDETNDIAKVLGFDSDHDFVKVEKKKIEDLSAFAVKLNNNALGDLCENLTRYNPEKIFRQYATYIDKLVQKYKDKKAKLTFSKGSSQLSFDEVKKIDGALIHILKNCLDHGIETINTRLDRGKSAVGLINIDVKRDDNNLNILITDDGGGIDAKVLSKKAISAGIWTKERAERASNGEKNSLIFEPNLSIKDNVTTISGRGVGMDAVKKIITDLGGKISVLSVIGSGSSFEIEYPTTIISKNFSTNFKKSG